MLVGSPTLLFVSLLISQLLTVTGLGAPRADTEADSQEFRAAVKALEYEADELTPYLLKVQREMSKPTLNVDPRGVFSSPKFTPPPNGALRTHRVYQPKREGRVTSVLRFGGLMMSIPAAGAAAGYTIASVVAPSIASTEGGLLILGGTFTGFAFGVQFGYEMLSGCYVTVVDGVHKGYNKLCDEYDELRKRLSKPELKRRLKER